MGNFATPLQLASIGSALVWPLAAGVAVVAWAKVRAAARARRVAAMERELQGFYRAVAAKPVPRRLSLVVEALEEGEELASGGAAPPAVGAKSPAGS